MTAICLVVDGNVEHAEALAGLSRDSGFTTYQASSVDDAATVLAQKEVDLVFLSLDLPGGDQGLALLEHSDLNGVEIVVMGEEDDPARADEAIRRGASLFFCKPFDEPHLRGLLQDIAEECVDADKQTSDATPVAGGIDQFGFLRGSSRAMRKVYRQLRKVAASDASLLVYGESGTGKELVARTVHTLSERREGPFVAFNCAAVAETLMESELFGHEKGSFSGAERRHRGYFEQAAGGTLLLDEITELDLELQAKLLRVLETLTVRRIGSESDIALDVRVISATNRPPEVAVAEGRLREDLYYRLAQFPVKLPPLRHRSQDIAGLAQYFLSELNNLHETELWFSAAALEQIGQHDWPGNVRQLRHAVERAYILSENAIEPDAFDFNSKKGPDSSGDVVEIAVGTSLADSEREIILATLEQNGGDKTATATALGISLKTLYNRLKDYGE
ncbi:sigma-54-dependent transcriptional regulator [Parahaliea aestuarii]|uniref:Sigma-54-dependent Fis family transcriptional regulator n=1 Tax=Parahaliea aestuarii TaxID=1852021 RepID=A0A5C8ZXN1_9GAMM|nr:sigma-54 dependent transcriptional regulator [Parahaliea aestuarii]TXS93208.1 sigma-54-dependent Fis family transcriptional regulator [Parahaliea aestuarii]